MKPRFVIVGIVAVTAALIYAFHLGTAHQSDSTAQTSTPSVSDAPAKPAKKPSDIASTIPAASGHIYHAVDLLLKRPFPDQGQLVTIDVMSRPYVDDYGRVQVYLPIIPRPQPDEANARGVRYKQMLSENICVYDVVVQISGQGRVIPGSVGLSADGRMISDTAGQIAVEVPTNANCPSSDRGWMAEPEGFQDVALRDGTLKQLPKIKVWRYQARSR